MIALIILGIIVGLIALIMLVPIGADIGYEDGKLSLSAKVCGVLLQILPKPPAHEAKPKKAKKEKKPKKEKKSKKQDSEAAKKPKKKLKLDFSKDEILSLIKKVLSRFGRFGRKFNVDRFLLHYVGGGKDPYDVAVNFAYINAALSGLAPMCAERFDVRDCDVWTDCDFTLDKPKIDFGLAFSIRIGAFFALAFGLVFSAAGILIRNKTRLLLEKLKNKKNTASVCESENNVELIEENIQSEERKD